MALLYPKINKTIKRTKIVDKRLKLNNMDLEYLKEEILPQREKEIKNGDKLFTSKPIYIVYSLLEHFCSDHSDFSLLTNLKGEREEFGFVDMSLESESREFKTSDKGMNHPYSVTRFYTDRFVAVFLTKKEANEYLSYQSHNLTRPYVYVHNSGYRNFQMDNLLKGE